MSDVNLGHILSEEVQRDAIHIAIAPVIAGENLKPGTHIGFYDDESGLVGTCNKPIGIVDPFLTRPVKKGERFYICLYPKTITSLKHVWTHPAFDDTSSSQEWLKQYAERYNPYYLEEGEPEKAFTTLIQGLQSGELFFCGCDLHGFYELPEPEELRYHAERYLGIKINWENFSFSCSC